MAAGSADSNSFTPTTQTSPISRRRAVKGRATVIPQLTQRLGKAQPGQDARLPLHARPAMAARVFTY